MLLRDSSRAGLLT